jgi:hypothetical protein
VAASVSHAGAAKWWLAGDLVDVLDCAAAVTLGRVEEAVELGGSPSAEAGVGDDAATSGNELTTWLCGFCEVADGPASAAGAASPPAVAKLATIPRTTAPFAGAAVADATAAWPSGVAETWVRSWIPACTGALVIGGATDDPVTGVVATSACAPAPRPG